MFGKNVIEQQIRQVGRFRNEERNFLNKFGKTNAEHLMTLAPEVDRL